MPGLSVLLQRYGNSVISGHRNELLPGETAWVLGAVISAPFTAQESAMLFALCSGPATGPKP